jgi:osmotically-inducible protein OsmY
MIKQNLARISFLVIVAVAFAAVLASAQGQYGGAQQNPKPDQSTTQQTPEQQQSQADAQTITAALRQDPSLGKVTVHADAQTITLSGTVTDKDSRDKAQQIAEQNAGGRKINNKIRINPNVHPGPGI